MNDWNEGYVSDISYTFGYVNELNPQRIKLAFLNKGLVFPAIGAACELGFGQGISANIHAAASVTQWYGTDFNPSQAGFAEELAVASGSGAKLFDEAFSEFANRTDLPEFDYICMHGIWSWISDQNRKVIIEFIRKKLKVGGVLYISYNTFPGWAAFAPIRHLMAQHASVLSGKRTGSERRILGAISYLQELVKIAPNSVSLHGNVVKQIDDLKNKNSHYLAHEYLNQEWQPMYFADVADWLDHAKMQYVCSADYLDHIDFLNLSTEQQKYLKSISDPIFQETNRDFIVNKKFRRDFWVKGVRKIDPSKRSAALRKQSVILTTHRSDVILKIPGVLGEATMSDEVYGPLLDILADYQIHTLGDLEKSLKEKNIPIEKIISAVMVLVGVSYLQVVRDDLSIEKTLAQTKRINFEFLHLSLTSGDIGWMASPVTEGGIMVNRFEKLFLMSILKGGKTPVDWAKYAWGVLASQNEGILKEGKVLSTHEENLAELTSQATIFREKRLSILKALQIA